MPPDIARRYPARNNIALPARTTARKHVANRFDARIHLEPPMIANQRR
jgi:hypothetical protein